MGNEISQNPMASQNPALDMLDQKEISNMIRYLGHGHAKLSTLIEMVDYKDGQRKTTKGLITKRPVKNVRYEMFSRTPRPTTCTVASGTEIESGGIVVDDANGILPESTLFNPANNTSARVEVITGSTLKGTSINSFVVAAGDVLTITAPATDEASETSSVYNGSDDQNYNTLQFSRWSVSITWVMQKVKQLAGGERLKREEMYLLWEALDSLDRNWIFSNMTTSGGTKNTTTGVQTGFTKEFPTNRGLISMAANSVSANGGGNIDWLVQQLPESMGEVTNDSDTYVALCSNEYLGRVVGEQQSKVKLDQSGILKEYGIKATDIVTSGPTISLVKYAPFNHPVLKNKMLIFAPADLGYVFMEGHDLGPNKGIQGNKAMFTQNEVYSYHGIETKNAGKTITYATNLF